MGRTVIIKVSDYICNVRQPVIYMTIARQIHVRLDPTAQGLNNRYVMWRQTYTTSPRLSSLKVFGSLDVVAWILLDRCQDLHRNYCGI